MATTLLHHHRRIIWLVTPVPQPVTIHGQEQNILLESYSPAELDPYQFHGVHHLICLEGCWRAEWDRFYGIVGRRTMVKSISDVEAVITQLDNKWRNSSCVNTTVAVTVPRDQDSQTLLRKQASVVAIPKTLHFMWLSPDNAVIPAKYQDNLKIWKMYHPEWTIRTWNMVEVNELMQQYYPQHYQQFAALPKIISKCDIARMAVLTVHGGLYADLDFRCMRGIDSLLVDKELVLAREVPEHEHLSPHLFNGLIASVPNQPFLRGWIDTMFSNLADSSDYGINFYVLNTTGPMAFYRYYLSIAEDKRPELTAAEHFLPFTDKYQLSRICPENVDYYAYTLWYEGSGWGQSSLIITVLVIIVLLIILIWAGYKVFKLKV